MEDSTEVPQKLKIELPYDLEISFLGIYLKELKTDLDEIFASLSAQEHYSNGFFNCEKQNVTILTIFKV